MSAGDDATSGIRGDGSTRSHGGWFVGKVALVTGASSGIGRAAAELFASAGASVVAADIADLDATLSSIEAAGGTVVAARADVTDDAAVRTAMDLVVQRFGRLDCAFNNAGVTLSRAPVHEMDVTEWHRTIEVNLTGVFLCMRHEIAVMLAGGGGAIVNTSSGAGVRGTPTLAAYAASKHGVVGLTRAAALEYADVGIRINALLPGLVRTPMLERSIGDDERLRRYYDQRSPSGRMAEPAEIAAAAVWLCSGDASYVNGLAMPVDAGATA